MARKLLLASAGAGKSERIAKEALDRAASGGTVLLLTYTINNQLELVRHMCRLNKFQPSNVVVKGWFSFLLEDMVRPYQRCIVPDRISGTILNPRNPHLAETKKGNTNYLPGRAERISNHFNPLHFVTKEDNRAHTYYLAKLAATIQEQTSGRPALRLAEIYDAIFVDEIQDLVGWDFAVIRAMAETSISEFKCVGDFRQSVYQTSETTKRPQTSTEKLTQFKDMGFEIDNLAISWRCIQSICDLADRLHANDGHYAPTQSQVATVPPKYAHHHGVFAVPALRIDDYIKAYNPVILRWDRRTKPQLCEGRTVYNFGESKGLSFKRVLIIPPKTHAKFLSGDTAAFDDANTDDSRNKLYVGITRARYSVAFWYDGGSIINGAQIWNPEIERRAVQELDWNLTEEHIRRTGEWWINPWWLQANFVEVIPRTEQQIIEAIDYLKEIFPAEWAREFPGNLMENSFLRSVLDWGAFSRAHLIRLSERLQRLRNVRGLHIVINSLHGKQESDAADMELEFADFFFEKGLEIEFPIPKSSRGKSPDLRINTAGYGLAVECKKLKIAKVTNFIQSAYTAANFKLNDAAHTRGLGWDFCFYDESMTEVLNLYSSGMDYTDLINAWGRRINDQLGIAARRGVWPLWIFMEGLGEGMFYPSADGAGSMTRPPDTPDEILARRLLANALAPAARQLEKEPGPGLIAISVRDIPNNQYLSGAINRFFEENREKHGNVVAVLVIPWQPWFYEDRPRLVLNRCASAGWSSEIESVIKKLNVTVL